MDYFLYRGNELFAEDVPLRTIAERYGTPCYVYSRATLERHWHAFDQAFGNHPHLICYAVKANSNLAVLNILAKLGSGFDIVSVGELERVLLANANPHRVVFSGVGKRDDEIHRALDVGIRCFNVEVPEELDRINRIAGDLGCRAPVSLRVNPDIDAKTHPYIATGLNENKFGIGIHAAKEEYQRAASMSHLDIVGIDCHIGSQLTELSPFIDALERILELAEKLKKVGISLHHLDLGGGLGIRYGDEQPIEPSEYVRGIFDRIGDTRFEILLEPGRAIAGNAGVLLTKIEFLKPTESKNFAIVDAAMNDLIRPSLYNAWQDIVPVTKKNNGSKSVYDIVGPVCETGDFLGKERKLDLAETDLLAIRSCGAYGFTMSSNYNSRPKSAEVMVDADRIHLVRERETLEQLWSGEHMLE